MEEETARTDDDTPAAAFSFSAASADKCMSPTRGCIRVSSSSFSAVIMSSKLFSADSRTTQLIEPESYARCSGDSCLMTRTNGAWKGKDIDIFVSPVAVVTSDSEMVSKWLWLIRARIATAFVCGTATTTSDSHLKKGPPHWQL